MLPAYYLDAWLKEQTVEKNQLKFSKVYQTTLGKNTIS